MRKILSSLFLILSMTIIATICFDYNVEASSTINYLADFSNGLPDGWTSYEKADPTHTTINKTDDGVAINHSNTAIDYKLYYGTLIDFGNEVENISDFTFEMDFRYMSYVNDTRWIGLLYHTQYDNENKLSSYGMNYRPVGKSAHVTLSSAPNFVDSDVKNTSVKMTDKQTYHTMKIVCEGTKVSHYIDTELVHEYDLNKFSAGLSEVQTYGGFGLIVNQCTIEIKRLSIVGTRVTPTLKMDNSLAELYDPKDGLVNDFSVNSRIDSIEDLTDIKDAEAKPHTAILSVNKNLVLTNSKNESLNVELAKAFNDYLKGNVMPAVKIEDEETAKAFIEYYNTKFKLLDIFVISTKPEIVKLVRTELTNIRGIIDYSNSNVDLEDLGNIVLTTNKSLANTIVLNSNDASYDAIRYVQARFKTVWIDNAEFNKLNIVNQIANGTYGIICSEYEKVYESLELFNGEDIKNINRAPYNVAHRGLCKSSYENSLEGYIEAYNNGATHLEIDVHLSKDDKIVVMHDETINRTTNGSGSIANMTYEEISQYKVVRNYQGKVMGEGVNIPLLEDVFKEFKGKDIVFVVEIKTTNTKFAKAFNQLLDEYNVKDQTVVISFHHSQLSKMSEDCPEIPTASLNGFTYNGLAGALVTTSSLNCGIDTSSANGTAQFTRATALRGYSSWYWTYDTSDAAYKGLLSGAQGITNNEANLFADYAIKAIIKQDYLVLDPDDYLSERAIFVKTFKGISSEKFLATPIYLEVVGDEAYVIYECTFTYGEKYYNIYTDIIRLVNKNEYMPLTEIFAYLSKNPESLTDSDVEILKTIENKTKLLSEKEQKEIDLSKVQELLSAYEEYKANQGTTNQPTPEPEPKKGCAGSLISSLIALVSLAGAVVLWSKKK